MNTRTKAGPNAALYPVTDNEGETQITGFPGDLHDVCTLGIGQAIEFQRAWLASIASLHSCAIGVSRSALRIPLPLDIFFDTMMRIFAPCAGLQQSWLNLMLPRDASKSSRSTVSPYPPEPGKKMEIAEDLIVETFENY
jgi:hypothetical protein